MRLLIAVLVVLAGMTGGVLAEEQQKKRPVRKQAKGIPEVDDEVVVNFRKQKAAPKKSGKWDGPDYDASKNERQQKGKK